MPSDSVDLRTIQEIRAVIYTEPGPIQMREFAEFFHLFRTAYAATVDSLVAGGELGAKEPSDSIDRIIRLTSDHLGDLSKGDIDRLGTRPLAMEPTILAIRRENPIELFLGGLAIAFAGAVILSGGKFKIPGLEVELPPLGQGIEQLRKAFRRSKKGG